MNDEVAKLTKESTRDDRSRSAQAWFVCNLKLISNSLGGRDVSVVIEKRTSKEAEHEGTRVVDSSRVCASLAACNVKQISTGLVVES